MYRLEGSHKNKAWLAYCDPPYVMGARKSGGYANELSDRDHEELIERLITYHGAVVLSGNASPIYEPLKKAGWEMTNTDVICTAAGRTRASGLKGAGNVKAKQKRTKCIWQNSLANINLTAGECSPPDFLSQSKTKHAHANTLQK